MPFHSETVAGFRERQRQWRSLVVVSFALGGTKQSILLEMPRAHVQEILLACGLSVSRRLKKKRAEWNENASPTPLLQGLRLRFLRDQLAVRESIDNLLLVALVNDGHFYGQVIDAKGFEEAFEFQRAESLGLGHVVDGYKLLKE